MGFPSNWSEVALISLMPQLANSSNKLELAAPTTTVDIDAGDKEIENKATLGGGRVETFTPEEDTVITFEAYTTSVNPGASPAEDIGLEQLFHTTSGNWDTTEPVAVNNSRNRDKFNLAIMWTNDATPTSATQGASIGNAARRLIVCNARMVSLKASYTDNELKVTAKFRVPAFQKNGNPNIRWESGRGNNSTETLLYLNSLGAVSLGPIIA